MKPNKQVTAALLGTALFSASAIAQEVQRPNLAELLASANTSYGSVEAEEISRSEGQQISSRLLERARVDLTADPVREDGDMYFRSSADPSSMLHIDRSRRSIVFNRGVADLVAPETTPALPSVEAAPELARQLLAELQLAPERSEELFVEHVGALNMGVEDANGETQVFEKARNVRFGRRLDGLPVLGRGSRISVQLGRQGELRGVMRRWREVSPNSISPGQKFSPQEVGEMIDLRAQTVGQHAKAVRLESTELVLFDDGRGVIEPVIRVVLNLTVESEVSGADGEMEKREDVNPFDFFVPVLRKPRAELPFISDLRMSKNLPQRAE